MSRRNLFTLVALFSILPFTLGTATAQVFFGGYYRPYYDPFWYYPWGPFGYYNYYYDPRPQLRIKIEPEDEVDDAAVFVDGAFAGVADDFDGYSQAMILSEGSHTVVLYLEGFRTAQFKVHLREGSTFKLRHTMERLAAGERSEPPSRSQRSEDVGS